MSGSVTLPTLYPLIYQRTTSTNPYNVCSATPRSGLTDNPSGVIDEGYYVYVTTNIPLTGHNYVANPSSGDIYNINSSTGLVTSYETNCSDEPTS